MYVLDMLVKSSDATETFSTVGTAGYKTLSTCSLDLSALDITEWHVLTIVRS